MSSEQHRESLEKELAALAEAGIQGDRQRLREDMCHQFENAREFARELAANSFDAAARFVRISGRETEDTVTIIVEDDGCGMDRQGVIDFMMLFRSRGRGNQPRRIGQHGIGKLSVAAMPGQSGFSMITSTGSECWRLSTGSLLDDASVRLECIAGSRPHGTRLEITFARVVPLEEELRRIRDVLYQYCRYLPMDIIVCMPGGEGDSAPPKHEYVRDEWAPQADRFGQGYTDVRLDDTTFEIILSLGNGTHELYQNRVLISTRYNLFSRDLSVPLYVPHIRVRVDSPDFEVPFGRHCLTNEEVLRSLSAHLRTKVLPSYVASLCSLYERDLLGDYNVTAREVEEVVCPLMAYDPSASRVWSNLAVFVACNGPRMSLVSIQSAVRRHGQIYIEDEESPGIDYTAFGAPVLSSRQTTGALGVLRKLFPMALVDLTVKDVVLEAPAGSAPELGPRELRLQRFLRFHPEAVFRARQHTLETCGPSDSGLLRGPLDADRLARLAGISEEARLAQSDLERIKWRVNYLVQRDGTTPCRSHRFLVKGDAVVVNLHHPDVARLLELTEAAPALAGHWGLAMCLSDTRKILPHLTPAAREDLILADAMAKCGADLLDEDPADGDPGGEIDPSWWDFRRDLQDENFGLE